jgi:MFS family permease
MAVALAFITYMDRVCISVTAPAIQRDLHLSPVQMGFVFSAFTAAYALFEIPTGWWADRRGSRHVLSRIVLWWSSFTALTGLAAGFHSLVVVRALFGAGEAGAWPTVARALARWFPVQERGSAQGIFFMGAHLGGGLTPLLVAVLAARVGWRATFPLLSIFGVLWVLAWRRWYWDEPRDYPGIPSDEVHFIESTRRSSPAGHREERSIFRSLLSSPSVWFLCLMYFTQTYGFNFYVTWLPTYLQQRGFTGHALALYAGLPLLLSVPADLFGGMLTDRLTRVYGLRIGRCLVGGISLGAACLFLFLGTRLPAGGAAAFLGLGAACSNFLLGAAWSSCSDIAEDNAGVLGAAMNTAGQVGGVLSPIVFALLMQQGRSWSTPLYLTAVLYALGAVSWCFIHPERAVHSFSA